MSQLQLNAAARINLWREANGFPRLSIGALESNGMLARYISKATS